MDVKIWVSEEDQLPTFARRGDAGADLRSSEDIVVGAGKSVLVKTGVKLALPEGYVALVCSRSGLALKNSVFVLNAPGVVDSGYRGEIGVILHNAGHEVFDVAKGDRIAQLMIQKVESPRWVWVESFDEDETERGNAGFGSTGKE